MTTNLLEALVYLWTRDAGFPVNKETEDYVVLTLKALLLPIEYSDKERHSMAQRIVNDKDL